MATAAFDTTATGRNACIITGNGDINLNSVTDGQSNSYTVLTEATFSNINNTWAAYATTGTGNASQVVTANFSGLTTNSASITCVHVLNATDFEASTDVVENGTNGNSFTAVMSLSTTTASTAVIRGCGVDRAGTTTLSTGGYTTTVQSANDLTSLWGKITAPISSETISGTFTNSPWWNCVSLALK